MAWLEPEAAGVFLSVRWQNRVLSVGSKSRTVSYPKQCSR